MVQVGVPGGDHGLPTLAQTWAITAFPEPEIVAVLVDAFGATMRASPRHYAALRGARRLIVSQYAATALPQALSGILGVLELTQLGRRRELPVVPVGDFGRGQ